MEQQNGAPKAMSSIRALDDLQYRIADPSLDWLQHLHTHGWAVAPIAGWDPKFTSMFFDWFESCNTNFRRNDPVHGKLRTCLLCFMVF